MQTISRAEAVAMIRSAKNTISVSFRKRTDGSARTINCNPAARTGITGAGARYDARSRGLIPVFVMNGDPSRGGWRSIPEEGIYRVRRDGEEYAVTGP